MLRTIEVDPRLRIGEPVIRTNVNNEWFVNPGGLGSSREVCCHLPRRTMRQREEHNIVAKEVLRCRVNELSARQRAQVRLHEPHILPSIGVRGKRANFHAWVRS